MLTRATATRGLIGATSGPDRNVVIEQRETTGTVVTQPSCESRTVQRQNSLGDTHTTTTTNCP